MPRRGSAPSSPAPPLLGPPQEDAALRRLVDTHGPKAWAKISGILRTKGPKQCRRRWRNFLNMDAKQCGWTAEVSPACCRFSAALRKLGAAA